MRLARSAATVACALALTLGFITGEATIMSSPSRPVTPREILIYHVDFDHIVVFARLLRSEPWNDGNGVGWKFELEPITYLKGGLDGDRLEVRYHSREVASQAEYDRITRPFLDLVGKETTAGVFFLRRNEGAWDVDPTIQGGLEQPLLRAPQSHWKALTDSVAAIIQDASLDSTLRRADLVAIVHYDPQQPRTQGAAKKTVPLVLDQTLAGSAPHSIRLRTLWGEFPDGQHLVCMKKGRDGIYEPLPFTRTVLSKEEKPGRGVVLGDERLNEVKSILARVRPQDAKTTTKP